eukprot:9892795-Alexandrium_andersonii.AAC.1
MRVVAQPRARESRFAADYQAARGPDPSATPEQEAGPTPTSFEERDEAIGRRGRWIDGGCLRVAVRKLGKNILVAHSRDDGAEAVYSFGSRKASKIVVCICRAAITFSACLKRREPCRGSGFSPETAARPSPRGRARCLGTFSRGQ